MRSPDSHPDVNTFSPTSIHSLSSECFLQNCIGFFLRDSQRFCEGIEIIVEYVCYVLCRGEDRMQDLGQTRSLSQILQGRLLLALCSHSRYTIQMLPGRPIDPFQGFFGVFRLFWRRLRMGPLDVFFEQFLYLIRCCDLYGFELWRDDIDDSIERIHWFTSFFCAIDNLSIILIVSDND